MIVDGGSVVLRGYEPRDRSVLIGILGHPDLMTFALEERPYGYAEAETFIDAHFRWTGGLGFGTVALRSTGQAIGFSGFRRCHYLGAEDIEFGWVVDRAYQGRGYATLLGKALIAHALTGWHLPRVLAACNPMNRASEHILCNKLHMRFESEVEPRPGFVRRVYSADNTTAG